MVGPAASGPPDLQGAATGQIGGLGSGVPPELETCVQEMPAEEPGQRPPDAAVRHGLVPGYQLPVRIW